MRLPQNSSQIYVYDYNLHYEDEAVRRRRPAGRCMLDNAQTLSCCYFMRYFFL